MDVGISSIGTMADGERAVSELCAFIIDARPIERSADGRGSRRNERANLARHTIQKVRSFRLERVAGSARERTFGTNAKAA